MTPRRCWAEIDLAALERNLNKIRRALPERMKYVSVVKADAYGHGIHPTVARLMQCGVDLFAVANVKEGIDIREMGSGWPILILGPLLEEEDRAIIDYDLIPSISNEQELRRFSKLAKLKGSPLSIHFKLDTGMGRTGCWWERGKALLEQIMNNPYLNLDGILTHFSEPSDLSFTNEQRNRFLQIALPAIRKIPDLLVHADNSSSLQTLSPDSPFNAVRIGLLQFGIPPPKGTLLSHLKVEPVLSFHSRIALLKELPAGTSLSYGREHTLKRNGRIGIIAAGYGDAIPLHCGGKAKGLIDGVAYPLIGRVTMDQAMMDLSQAPAEIKNGSLVTLIGSQKGKNLSLTELAEAGNTIAWELLCSITKRVPRLYLTKRE